MFTEYISAQLKFVGESHNLRNDLYKVVNDYYTKDIIPELDYFIEVQGYYTHGDHPFDSQSQSDLNLVQKYKERYGPNCQAITIWTIKDVEKRECAQKNNLKFKEIWTLDEGKKFIDFLYEIYK